MKRVLCTVIGLALCTAAVVGFCYALYTLGRIGTCASGGAYVSARPCPPGTAGTALLIPASIIGGLAGVAIYFAGGSFQRSSPVSLGILMWSFTFLGAAGSLAYAAWGPAASPDGGNGVETAAVILLIIFVPMGVIPLIGSLIGGRSKNRARHAAALSRMVPGGASSRSGVTPSFVIRATTPAPAATATAAAGSGDVVTRLERLSALRQSGAITTAEFDRLKGEVLGGR